MYSQCIRWRSCVRHHTNQGLTSTLENSVRRFYDPSREPTLTYRSSSFLIEGLPTCAFSLVAWFGLPDSIAQAKFLNEREQQIAYQFTARNQRIDVDRNQGLRFKELLSGIKDPKSWIPGIMYFSW